MAFDFMERDRVFGQPSWSKWWYANARCATTGRLTTVVTFFGVLDSNRFASSNVSQADECEGVRFLDVNDLPVRRI
jgi:hypothetical protein